MPEYLAPAVYVEETSFRSKPLEGVSTSTTCFVGPTAIGPFVPAGAPEPVSDVPELLTSVGDYERVYGGTSSLQLGSNESVNYMAHAVRAFFDNGGRRLYVARVYQPVGEAAGAGVAFSDDLVDASAASIGARFVARYAGATGNGRVELREQRATTTRFAIDRAPNGTMIRTGAANPAAPAAIAGGRPPFVVPNGAVLVVSSVDSGAAPVVTTVTFQGTSTQLTGTPVLDGGGLFNVTDATLALNLTINGLPQVVDLPVGAYTIQQLANAINTALRGGYANASGNDIIIGSEITGTGATLEVTGANDYGFAAAVAPSGTGNVHDLSHVSAQEIATLLAAAPVDVTVGPDLHLRISTRATGSATNLTFSNQAGSPSAAIALDLAVDDPVPGEPGSQLQLFIRRNGAWLGSNGTPADLSGDLGGIELLSLNATSVDAEGHSKTFEDLSYDAAHLRYIGSVLGLEPPRRSDALENRFALQVDNAVNTAAVSWPFALRRGLLVGGVANAIALRQGNDGLEPTAERYREALRSLISIENISIVAAPGSSELEAADAITTQIINHVERRRAYQIAVLDTPRASSLGEAREHRGSIDSKYAAIYYPWVRIPNPDLRPGDISTPRELDVPPSGFICGIYARNDTERGVHKAPANEVVRGAVSFETLVNFAQQEELNPSGINVLRFFPGRGFRVWGARLATSDPEWKYVSLRRYFNYVEASVDRGTQWVVFEPNGPRLWQSIRNTISDFLFSEWRNGALLGNSPSEAFFVRVDRSTMTENDLDNGRLIVEVGIAVVKPAEFVIFRIGQKTADKRA